MPKKEKLDVYHLNWHSFTKYSELFFSCNQLNVFDLQNTWQMLVTFEDMVFVLYSHNFFMPIDGLLDSSEEINEMSKCRISEKMRRVLNL